jgi:hypothetical protein
MLGANRAEAAPLNGDKEMGFMVSNLYSLGQSESIKQYLYILEPADLDDDLKGWLNDNFRQLGAEIGSTTALVRGYNPFVSTEIFKLLARGLRPEKWEEVEGVVTGKVSIIASKYVLPSTDEMTILPVCERDDTVAVLKARMTGILEAMRGGQEELLFDSPNNVRIHISDFRYRLTDWGVRKARALTRMLSIGIPGTPFSVKAEWLGEKLLSHYPKVR